MVCLALDYRWRASQQFKSVKPRRSCYQDWRFTRLQDDLTNSVERIEIFQEEKFYSHRPGTLRLVARRDLEIRAEINSRRSGWRSLFVITEYASADFSPDAIKDIFHRTLHDVLRVEKRSDIVILAGDMNARAG